MNRGCVCFFIFMKFCFREKSFTKLNDSVDFVEPRPGKCAYMGILEAVHSFLV